MYTWSYSAIKCIADLETSCHTTFIEVNDIINDLDRLQRHVKHLFDKDEELEKEFNKFYDLLDNKSNTYSDLVCVMEVI